VNLTRRQRAVMERALALYTGQKPASRAQAIEWEALRRADRQFGSTRGVRRPLRPA
jgi:hypothetical protein